MRLPLLSQNPPLPPPPLPAPFWPGQKSPPILTHTSQSFTSSLDLSMLHHFLSHTARDLFDPRAMYGSQDIDIMSLAVSHAHIMHAILAAAALHLHETTPSGSRYTELETSHWLSASSSFRGDLTRYDASVNPDPLLTTCMLLNLLAFAHVGPAEVAFSTNRWPFTPTTPTSLQWLALQLGLTPLLTGLSQRTKGDSIWLPLFLASSTADLYDNRDGVDDIPSHYIALFELTEESVCEAHDGLPRHPYLRLVRRVVSLRKLYNEATDPANHTLNCLKYVQFVQAVDADVIRRLEEKDPRTLLLYALWTGVLCAVEYWWCRPRAVSECWAVTRWLDERYGAWLGVGRVVGVSGCGGGLYFDVERGGRRQ